jgi:nucleotide-binding universal stress UspA family protein
VTITYGTPHSGILRTAERIRAGIIVVGGIQQYEGQATLGRVAEQVVRHALSPVLVARPSRAGRVLAATDFSDQALPAVQAGVAEAHRHGTDLVLIHVVDLLPPTIPALPSFLAEGIRKTQREKLEDCVRRYEARGGGLLSDGLAAPAILRAAEELPAQLLVVGTHGRTGLKRLVLGSVAESVVRGAHCTVLAVRLAP